MRFRLLGEVEMSAAGRSLPVGPPRQQAVLAVLLVDAGRPVDVDTIVDRVWAEAAPAHARDVLYSHLSRIRRLLTEDAGGAGPRLERRPGGYLLDVDPDDVDLHRFRRLAHRCRGLTAAADRAAAARGALDLWSDPPLPGIPGDWAAAVRDELRQLRLETAIRWAEAELAAGRPGPVVDLVPALVAEYPLAEPLEEVLIRALHAAGRQAEALGRYAAVRRRLVAELGTEPGAPLRQLHEAILRDEQPAARRTPTPAQLPADVPGFVGRQPELAELDRQLAAGGAGGTVVISAVAGTAGVGKTALAVHWAHRVRSRFPDGQLFVNLRGYDPEQPMPPDRALAGFLTALGVSEEDIPLELADRAARFRTEVGDRRMLLVLDNAGSGEQIRPLLPGTGSCAVVVTSRDSLAGLVALHGANRLELELLPPADAITLLRTLIGTRADADAPATAALADLCVRLPLALRVAAVLVLTQPGRPLAELVGELAETQRRLDLLDAGDRRAAVRAVFSWSYRHLPAAAKRTFRLLGLHPGTDCDGYGAAALTGAGLPEARRAVDQLARAHLVEPAGPGRYGMHDLLRAYAAELAAAEESAPDRRAALTRLFDYLLAGTAAAADLLAPAERHYRRRPDPTGGIVPPLPDATAARGWLDAERRNLVAAAAFTAAHGWPGHTTRLAENLFRYLESGAHHVDSMAVHEHARQAAQQDGDPVGEATALTNIGRVLGHLGRAADAVAPMQQALTIRRSAGDRRGEAETLGALGIISWRLGRFRDTLIQLQRALVVSQEVGDRVGTAVLLGNLGVAHLQLGQYRDAFDHYTEALALHEELGNLAAAAGTLNNLGEIAGRWGRYVEAGERLQAALRLARQVGDRTIEAEALINLGYVHMRRGDTGTALGWLTEAVALTRESGDRALEMAALTDLGRTQLRHGRPAAAASLLDEARELAEETDDHGRKTDLLISLGEHAQLTGRYPEAARWYGEAAQLAGETGDSYCEGLAQAGLAAALDGTGQRTEARQHWQLARKALAGLDVPEAADVRRRLESS